MASTGVHTHSLWGCVVEDIKSSYQLKTVERPFRITSASIQAPLSIGLRDNTAIAILVYSAGQNKPLQIAQVSQDHPRVDLDFVFKVGDKVAFVKKTILGSGAEVQIMGHYLDDCEACTGKKASPLPTEGMKMVSLAPFKDTMTAIFVEENMEINIKKRELGDIDKMKTENKELKEELKRKNEMVEKLYSQVEELTVKVQQIEMVDIDKMETENNFMKEELKKKNEMVEKLYSEVDEFKMKVQQMEMVKK